MAAFPISNYGMTKDYSATFDIKIYFKYLELFLKQLSKIQEHFGCK